MRVPSCRRLLSLLLGFVLGVSWLCADGVFIAEELTLPATTDGQTTFVTVQFTDAFDTAPVVMLTPNSQNPDPAGLRIRNVTPEGFEVQIVEATSENGEGPGMTNISFFAAEPGLYSLDGGQLLEVGFVSTNETVGIGDSSSFQSVSLNHNFASTPSLLALPQTMVNETGAVPGDASDPWLTATVRNATSSNFQVALDLAQTGSGDLAAQERIGFIALEQGSGSFTDNAANAISFDSFRTADDIDGNFNTVNYPTTFGAAPLVQASLNSRDGGDGGWARYDNNTASSVQLTVEEDRALDSEQGHTDEIIGVVAFSEGFVESLTRKTTYTWSGGGANDNTTTGANWSGWDGSDASLSTGDVLLFNDTGAARTTPSIDATYNTELGQIRFEEATSYSLNDGGGAFTLAEGGSIVNHASVDQTIAVDITTAGSTAGIRADGGNLTFTSAANFDLSATGAHRLFLSGPDDIEIAGDISGAGAQLIKSGTGTVTLTGNNSYTGGMRIDNGTVIGDSASLSGDIQNDSFLTFEQASTGTYTGDLSGSGDVTKTGAGTLSLSGTNTFTGSTTISEGTLSIDSDARLGTVPASPTTGHLTLNGGTLEASDSFALDANRGLTVGASGGTLSAAANESLSYSGVLSGSGDLTFDGDGTVTLSGSSANTLIGGVTLTSGTLNLAKNDGTNALASNISLDGGVLQLGANNQLANAVNMDFNGGVFELLGFSEGDESTSGINQLNLLDNSTLRFAGLSSFRFASETFTAGNLTVEGWVGDPVNGSSASSANRFLVETDLTGDPILTQIIFGDWNNASAKVIDPDNDGIFEIVPDITVFQWDQDVSGDWNTGTNWSGGPGFPDAIGHVAQLVDITADRTVTLTADHTIGSLDIIEDNNAYTVTGNTLIFARDALGTDPARLGMSGNGDHEVASNITLDSDLQIFQNGSASSSLTVSGVIADGSNGSTLLKDGSGIVSLTGNNTYTGSTTLRGGVLVIESDQNLGAVPGSPTASQLILAGGILRADNTFTLASNRGIELASGTDTIDVTGTETLTYGGIMTGAGDFVKSGTGTLVLTGANTFTGKTTVSGGTLEIDADASLGAAPGAFRPDALVLDDGTLRATANLTLNSNRGVTLEAAGGTLDISSGQTLTAASVITGDGDLAVTGTGTLDLNGSNSYTGSTSVTDATLRLADDANLGTAPNSATPGHLTLDNATLQLDASFTLDSNRGIELGAGGATIETTSGRTLTYDGIITGTGGLTKTDSGRLNLNGANTYAGDTTLSAGTLGLGHSSALSTGDLVVDGAASLRSNTSNLTVGNAIVLNDDLNAGGTEFTLSGNISGTGGLVKQEAGRLILSGNNSYSGDVSLERDQLRVTNNNALGTGSVTASSLATALEFSSGVSSFSNDLQLNTTIDLSADGNTTASGVISGTGTLGKTGSGTLVLTNTNTYSGGTTIDSGVLQVGDGGTSGTLSSGPVTGSGTGGLVINRSDTLTFTSTVDVPDFTLQSGTFATTGNIKATDSFTLASGTNLQVDGSMTLDLSETGSANTSIANDATLNVTAGQQLTIEVSSGLPALTAETLYHDFDVGTGAIAGDDSGNGFDGTALGSGLPTFDLTNFIGGTSSAAFDGTQGISFADGNQLITNDAESIFSVATWVQLNSTSGTNVIFEEGGGTNGVQIWTDGTTLNASIKNNFGSPAASISEAGAVSEGTWAHVAVVFENSTFSLFLNGEKVGEETFTSVLNTHSSDGGIGNVDGSPFVNGTLNGNLDEFYYFNDLALRAGNIDGFAGFDLTTSLGNLVLATGSTATVNNTGVTGSFTSITANGDSTLEGSTVLELSGVEVASSATLTVTSNLTGNNALNKTGAGTLSLQGSSNFTGDINVGAGTVEVTGSLYNGVDGGSLVVATGGTLLLDGTGVLSSALSAPDVVLNGGTLEIGSGADGGSFQLGSLTLNADSVIDFAGSNATIDFSSLELNGYQLQIWNYDGTKFTGDGAEQISFGEDLGLRPSSQIAFYDGGPGSLIGPYSLSLPDGEVVPVPEPTTWLAGISLLLLATGHGWRRYQRRKQAADQE